MKFEFLNAPKICFAGNLLYDPPAGPEYQFLAEYHGAITTK